MTGLVDFSSLVFILILPHHVILTHILLVIPEVPVIHLGLCLSKMLLELIDNVSLGQDLLPLC